ncbi:MAG: dienelactone hydrolase family protein [Fibrobacter sp.]|nr:dienelactone hydrolase family protein [Fibrobacter sp.]
MKKTIFTLLVALCFLSVSGMESLPVSDSQAVAYMDSSPLKGTWVTIDAGENDMLDAWVVMPKGNAKAPVVIVVHEIFGLTDWARSVTVKFADEGFIAVAPDFLTGKASDGKGGTRMIPEDQRRGINSSLSLDDVSRRIEAAATWATNQKRSMGKYAVVGYCWGGGATFNHATRSSKVAASVVYYGAAPAIEKLSTINAPILGLYGGADNRINVGIAATETEMKRLNKRYDVHVYDGASHAFLKNQSGQEGANLKATEKAWPTNLAFLRELLK